MQLKDQTTPRKNQRFLRNKGVFSFSITKDGFIHSGDHPTWSSIDGGLQVYLNGVIYNCSGEQLLEGFSTQGVDFVKDLEGSFVIFIIQGGAFHLITDIVNSKKAFYACLDQTWYISNDINHLPRKDCSISWKGLASYLASGVMLNNLTIFAEIQSACRASIHTVKNGELTIKRYWCLPWDNPRWKCDVFFLLSLCRSAS
jgi:hypothetical protein